jgi:methylase of polypeptide subunit release factors
MIDRPYIYAEDSMLLGEVISSLEDSDSFLEIGAGNGGNLLKAKVKFKVVVGTDISLQVRRGFPPKLQLVIADKASCFRTSSFDFIAFNPPYVPSEGIEDRTTDGGPTGMDIPMEFLVSALEVMKPGGKIAMLVSSEDSIEELENFCEKNDLLGTKVAKAGLFFESLFVYLIRRPKDG